jgi:excisionase family DNA binding protein
MTEIDLTKILTKKEKAKELAVSTKTIERMVNSNRLSFIRIPNSKRRWFLPKNTLINP